MGERKEYEVGGEGKKRKFGQGRQAIISRGLDTQRAAVELDKDD